MVTINWGSKSLAKQTKSVFKKKLFFNIQYMPQFINYYTHVAPTFSKGNYKTAVTCQLTSYSNM